MTKLTQNERLAVVEEQIKEIKKALNEGFDNSKTFHADLIARLDVILKTFNDDKTSTAKEIATLKEQVKTSAKIIWTALGAGISGLVLALMEILQGR